MAKDDRYQLQSQKFRHVQKSAPYIDPIAWRELSFVFRSLPAKSTTNLCIAQRSIQESQTFLQLCKNVFDIVLLLLLSLAYKPPFKNRGF
jgi:hypothetical protein